MSYKFSNTKQYVAIGLLLIPLLAAAQQSVEYRRGCTLGNQDMTCVKTALIAPPALCNGVGQTTQTAASWNTSTHAWNAPVCKTVAEPSCPPGYIQSGPTWNGSAWVGLSCTAPPSQQLPPAPASPSTVGCGSNNILGSLYNQAIAAGTSQVSNCTVASGGCMYAVNVSQGQQLPAGYGTLGTCNGDASGASNGGNQSELACATGATTVLGDGRPCSAVGWTNLTVVGEATMGGTDSGSMNGTNGFTYCTEDASGNVAWAGAACSGNDR